MTNELKETGSMEPFESCYEGLGDCEKALDNVEKALGFGWKSRKWRRRIALAASVLPVAALLFFLAGQGTSPEWHETVVPAGSATTMTLADGTVLQLNGGSRLTCPDRFDGRERRIFLDGQVLADVVPDPSRPFVIEAGDVTVKVTGTRFDLKAYQSSEFTELLLIEGKVSMEAGNRSITLSPGDFLQYEHGSGNYEFSHGTVKGSFADSGLHFINEKMSDIAADLERNFGARIIVTDHNLADSRYLAFFKAGATLEDILSSFRTDPRMDIASRDGVIYMSLKEY